MKDSELEERWGGLWSAAALAERIFSLPAKEAVVEAILEHSFAWARDEILADQSLADAEMNYRGRLGLVVFAYSLEMHSKAGGAARSITARKSAQRRTGPK